MALVCTKITTWITQQITKPVDTWVHRQQQQCKKLHWWNPLSWFCWFITILVKVIVWVTENILIPMFTVSCTFVMWVVGFFVLLVAIFIDVVCERCNAQAWVNLWFFTPAKITFVKSEPSRTQIGSFDYTFICNCGKKGGSSELVVTAATETDAKDQAIMKCTEACQ